MRNILIHVYVTSYIGYVYTPNSMLDPVDMRICSLITDFSGNCGVWFSFFFLYLHVPTSYSACI